MFPKAIRTICKRDDYLRRINSIVVDIMRSLASVLTTVNAPYGKKLDGQALAYCLADTSLSSANLGHMSSFFSEVPIEDQKAFARQFGISEIALVSAARAFADYSGQSCPLAA